MKKKTSKLKVFIIALVILIALIGSSLLFVNYQLSPVSDKSQKVNFLIKENDNLTSISNKLESEEIIKSAFFTKAYGKVFNVSQFIKGPFELNKNWDSKKILKTLTNAENVIVNEVSVTLQEGLWAKDNAEKIGLKTDVSAKQLLELWNNPDYVRSLMDKYNFLTEEIFNDDAKVLLEGYLAPNTYNFYIDTSAKVITEKLLDQSQKVFDKYYDEFMASEYSIHQLYSLASLTQYESGNYEDDQIIAGIWYNRLDLGMRLESSAAVCYALYEFDNWEECEKNTNYDSPYNNYLYAGIMPGPVTNPGESSIKATLYPKDTDYLFFLADAYGDKKIYYSKTFEEHSKKVNKYLR